MATQVEQIDTGSNQTLSELASERDSDSSMVNTRDNTSDSGQSDQDMGPQLSKKWIDELFKKEWKMYYRTYELNEKLYFHYKGFDRVQNMHLFPDLKCFYFEGNGVKKIEGFELNTKMMALYIHENCIQKMEGLDTMVELRTLNLTDNMLTKVEGLSNLKKLDTLYLKRNRIGKNGTVEDLKGLLECPSITCVDLSENAIDDEEVLPEIFEKMVDLKVLYLQGNPVTKKIKNYRKTLIAKLKNLTYLDDRPVFEDDRRYAEAYYKGGYDEERKERDVVKEEQRAKDKRNRDAFKDMMKKAREEKRLADEAKAAKAAEDKENQPVNQKEEPKVQEIKEEKVEKVDTVETKEDEDCPPELEQVDLEEERRNQEAEKLLKAEEEKQKKEWFDKVTAQQQERDQKEEPTTQPTETSEAEAAPANEVEAAPSTEEEKPIEVDEIVAEIPKETAASEVVAEEGINFEELD